MVELAQATHPPAAPSSTRPWAGYGDLTVAQIVAEFGVTRPTIYRHLDRLDDLDAASR